MMLALLDEILCLAGKMGFGGSVQGSDCADPSRPPLLWRIRVAADRTASGRDRRVMAGARGAVNSFIHPTVTSTDAWANVLSIWHTSEKKDYRNTMCAWYGQTGRSGQSRARETRREPCITFHVYGSIFSGWRAEGVRE